MPDILYECPLKPAAWNERDALLFANSIGCTPDQLHYLYELHPSFSVFPTYPIVLTFKHDASGTTEFETHFRKHLLPPPGSLGPRFPKLDIARVVDGARTLEILLPLPSTSAGRCFQIRSRVVGVRDLGPGKSTIVQTEHLLFEQLRGSNDELGERIYTKMTETAVFMAQGGWDGPKTPLPPILQVGQAPSGPPTVSVKHAISPTAHLMYRLNGDYNPLHATEVAGAVVQPTPIMHGLYSWNAVCRDILATFTSNTNAYALKSFSARFTSPVRPGDVLHTDMWLVPAAGEDANWIVRFTTSVNDKIVLADGMAVLLASALRPLSPQAKL